MIHKITIENFFSIAEAQELSFEMPRNAPDLPCFRPSQSDSEIRLPTVIGFFGPNASGKSTVLRAVVSAVIFAIHSFDFSNLNAFQINTFFQPYRQKDWWGKPSKIIIEFDNQLSDGDPFTIFRYELHITHHANDPNNKVISYEALSYAPNGKFRRLFEREGQKFLFGREFDISSPNDPRAQSIRPNASVISTLTKLNHPLASYLSQTMGKLKSNTRGNHLIPSSVGEQILPYIKDKDCLARLNTSSRRLDVGLESITIKRGDKGEWFMEFHHVGLGKPLYFDEESQGTQRFINIFPHLYYALETGSVIMIDEIDNHLHPLLLLELFRWFGDSQRNSRGAQLFFTANNSVLLDDLEKEQVFFTEKPSGQPSQVYGARDIKGLRREPSLMKKYLSGELGAVPHIG